MRKTILIPTDFSVQSLSVLKSILGNNSSKNNFNIVLTHGYTLSNSIMDLLFYSKNQQINELKTSEFNQALEVIKNKYQSQINSITIKLFNGFTVAAFNTFLEANCIEEIFIADQKMNFKNKKSFNLGPFIKKCNGKFTTVNVTSFSEATVKDKVAEVFNQMSIG